MTTTGKFYAEIRYGDQTWDAIDSDDPYAIEAWVRDIAPVINDDERYEGEGDYLHGEIRWGLTANLAPHLLTRTHG